MCTLIASRKPATSKHVFSTRAHTDYFQLSKIVPKHTWYIYTAVLAATLQYWQQHSWEQRQGQATANVHFMDP